MAHEQTFRITHRNGSVIVMAKSETDKALWLSSLDHQMKLRQTSHIGTVASGNRIVHEVCRLYQQCYLWIKDLRSCTLLSCTVMLARFYAAVTPLLCILICRTNVTALVHQALPCWCWCNVLPYHPAASSL